MFDYEKMMERNAKRRVAAEDRYLTSLDKRMNAADPLVGELCREGKTIYYINVRTKDGHLTGRTREFGGDRGAAVAYLLRNNYV